MTGDPVLIGIQNGCQSMTVGMGGEEIHHEHSHSNMRLFAPGVRWGSVEDCPASKMLIFISRQNLGGLLG